MKKAISSALLVLLVGFFGCFLGVAGLVLGSVSTATSCIIYAIYNQKNEQNGVIDFNALDDYYKTKNDIQQ